MSFIVLGGKGAETDNSLWGGALAEGAPCAEKAAVNTRAVQTLREVRGRWATAPAMNARVFQPRIEPAWVRVHAPRIGTIRGAFRPVSPLPGGSSHGTSMTRFRQRRLYVTYKSGTFLRLFVCHIQSLRMANQLRGCRRWKKVEKVT